jgi:hypothetical protein
MMQRPSQMREDGWRNTWLAALADIYMEMLDAMGTEAA